MHECGGGGAACGCEGLAKNVWVSSNTKKYLYTSRQTAVVTSEPLECKGSRLQSQALAWTRFNFFRQKHSKGPKAFIVAEADQGLGFPKSHSVRQHLNPPPKKSKLPKAGKDQKETKGHIDKRLA